MKPRVVMLVMGTLGAGGAQRYLLTFLRGLDRSRWCPVVCSMRGGPLADDVRQLAPTHVLDKRRKVELGLLGRIRRLLDRYQPAIIHTSMSTANTWGRLAVALRPSDRPVVIASEHGVESWKNLLHLAADRVLMGVTDAVVGHAKAISRHLIEHDRLSPDKVFTIPTVADIERAQRHLGCGPEERAARRARLGFAQEHFVVGHVGRAHPVKGLETLLDVIERLHELDPSARLLRVAKPPLPDEAATAAAFDRAVRDRGLEDVVRKCPFSKDISYALSMMDVLIQTSVSEGVPTSPMEAMAMELPVVATAAGGTSEVVRHRQTGWLAPVGDRDGLVAGLRHVRSDADEARRWGVAARRLIESEYSPAVMVSRTTDLYEYLLQKRL